MWEWVGGVSILAADPDFFGKFNYALMWTASILTMGGLPSPSLEEKKPLTKYQRLKKLISDLWTKIKSIFMRNK